MLIVRGGNMGILRNHLETECDPRLAGELSYSIKEAYRSLWEYDT